MNQLEEIFNFRLNDVTLETVFEVMDDMGMSDIKDEILETLQMIEVYKYYILHIFVFAFIYIAHFPQFHTHAIRFIRITLTFSKHKSQYDMHFVILDTQYDVYIYVNPGSSQWGNLCSSRLLGQQRVKTEPRPEGEVRHGNSRNIDTTLHRD